MPEPWLAGTLDEVAARLQELAEAGVERTMCQHLLHRDLDAIGQIGQLSGSSYG